MPIDPESSDGIDILNLFINLPIENTINSTDYITINQTKEMKQIRLEKFLQYVLDKIPVTNPTFTEALTLKDIILAITNKISKLSTSDICYDGEIRMEFGNLKGVLTYILDQVETINSGGISTDNIAYIPGPNTPDHVNENLGSGSKSIEDIIDYILNHYRYKEDDISGNKVSIDSSKWKNDNLPVTKNTMSSQEALDLIYKHITSNIDSNKKIYVTNASDITFTNSDTPQSIAINTIGLKHDTMLTISFCFSILCDWPGILQVSIDTPNKHIDYFEDALTSGYHTINQNTFTKFTLESDNVEQEITISMKYIKDVSVEGSSPIIATIHTGEIRLIYEGDNIYSIDK